MFDGWDLPTTVELGGRPVQIRTDFRDILNLMSVLADDTITDEERGFVAFLVFFPGFEDGDLDDIDSADAMRAMSTFLNGGKEEKKDGKRQPRLMDWEQDFHLIVGPVNRVLGYECRAVDYLHWWTFLGAYMEIGECYFQQIVGIRSKKARGKKLDKSDQEFYNKHREDIDLKREITEDERDMLDELIGVRR